MKHNLEPLNVNSNEYEVKSESGFFLCCLDSVLFDTDYKRVEKKIILESLTNDQRIYKATLGKSEFLVIDDVPEYEIQCSGYYEGYFIPSGESLVGIFPRESCNEYLFKVDLTEGLYFSGKKLTVKEIVKNEFKVEIDGGIKQMYFMLNNPLLPKLLNKAKSYEDG